MATRSGACVHLWTACCFTGLPSFSPKHVDAVDSNACRDLGCLERGGTSDGFCAKPRALGTLAPELANIK